MQATMLLTVTMVALLGRCDTTRLQYSRHNWLLFDSSDSSNTYYLLPPDEEIDLGNMGYHQTIDTEKAKDVDLEQNTDNKVENEDKHEQKLTFNNNNGVRKQQWHNYPRQLDRLERSKRDFSLSESDGTEKNGKIINYGNDYLDGQTDVQSFQWNDLLSDETSTFNNLEKSLVDDLTPILLLRIKLSILRWKDQQLGRKDKKHNFMVSDNMDAMKTDDDDHIAENSPLNDMIRSYHPPRTQGDDSEIKTIYVTRGRLTSSQKSRDYPELVNPRARSREKRLPQDELLVSKRIFSFWSRLQGMKHSGRELEHRRHFHAYTQYPGLDSHGDIVSAETRAALARPPGSPLRWG